MILLDLSPSDTIKVLAVNQPMTFEECLRDPGTIIAISAIFISIVGVGLSVYTAYLTRRHNRISIEPLIQHTIDETSNTILAKIDNSGLGTAIITKFKLHINGKSYHNIDPILKLSPRISATGKIFTFGKTNYLSSNDSIILFELTIDNEEERNEFRKLIKTVTIEIDYRSAYGKKKKYKHLIDWITLLPSDYKIEGSTLVKILK